MRFLRPVSSATLSTPPRRLIRSSYSQSMPSLLYYGRMTLLPKFFWQCHRDAPSFQLQVGEADAEHHTAIPCSKPHANSHTFHLLDKFCKLEMVLTRGLPGSLRALARSRR